MLATAAAEPKGIATLLKNLATEAPETISSDIATQLAWEHLRLYGILGNANPEFSASVMREPIDTSLIPNDYKPWLNTTVPDELLVEVVASLSFHLQSLNSKTITTPVGLLPEHINQFEKLPMPQTAQELIVFAKQLEQEFVAWSTLQQRLALLTGKYGAQVREALWRIDEDIFRGALSKAEPEPLLDNDVKEALEEYLGKLLVSPNGTPNVPGEELNAALNEVAPNQEAEWEKRFENTDWMDPWDIKEEDGLDIFDATPEAVNKFFVTHRREEIGALWGIIARYVGITQLSSEQITKIDPGELEEIRKEQSAPGWRSIYAQVQKQAVGGDGGALRVAGEAQRVAGLVAGITSQPDRNGESPPPLLELPLKEELPAIGVDLTPPTEMPHKPVAEEVKVGGTVPTPTITNPHPAQPLQGPGSGPKR